MKTILIETNQILWDMSKYPPEEEHRKQKILCSYENIVIAVLVVREAESVWVNRENSAIIIATVPDDFDCEEMLQLTGVFSLSQEPIKKQPLVLFCQEIPPTCPQSQEWGEYILGRLLKKRKEHIGRGMVVAAGWQVHLCEEAIPDKFKKA